MNLLRGLQSYFTTSHIGPVQLLDTRVYIWNIPCGAGTQCVQRTWKVGRTTQRAVSATCAQLDVSEKDRYMIFNFSPLAMELVESCEHGQVLDFSCHSMENFALLLEVCFTIRKWLSARRGGDGGAGGDGKDAGNCAILAFLAESPNVAHANYAAMLAACYLIFAGLQVYGAGGMLDFVEHTLALRRSQWHARTQEQYTTYFQLLLELPIVPNPHRMRLTGVSLCHASSELCGRKLGMQIAHSDGVVRWMSDPTAWRYNRGAALRSVSASASSSAAAAGGGSQNRRAVLHEKDERGSGASGLGVAGARCCSSSSRSSSSRTSGEGAELFLALDESFLGDFVLHVFDYGAEDDVATTSTSGLATGNIVHEAGTHGNGNGNGNDSAYSSNPESVSRRNSTSLADCSMMNAGTSMRPATRRRDDDEVLGHTSRCCGTDGAMRTFVSTTTAAAEAANSLRHPSGATRSIFVGGVRDGTTAIGAARLGSHAQLHRRAAVRTSSTASATPSATRRRTCLLRLAFSTIFILHTTHWVRVREMDYARTKSSHRGSGSAGEANPGRPGSDDTRCLPDDFGVMLHFETIMQDSATDVDYVAQLAQRIENSVQRQRVRDEPETWAGGGAEHVVRTRREEHSPAGSGQTNVTSSQSGRVGVRRGVGDCGVGRKEEEEEEASDGDDDDDDDARRGRGGRLQSSAWALCAKKGSPAHVAAVQHRTVYGCPARSNAPTDRQQQQYGTPRAPSTPSISHSPVPVGNTNRTPPCSESTTSLLSSSLENMNSARCVGEDNNTDGRTGQVCCVCGKRDRIQPTRREMWCQRLHACLVVSATPPPSMTTALCSGDAVVLQLGREDARRCEEDEVVEEPHNSDGPCDQTASSRHASSPTCITHNNSSNTNEDDTDDEERVAGDGDGRGNQEGTSDNGNHSRMRRLVDVVCARGDSTTLSSNTAHAATTVHVEVEQRVAHVTESVTPSHMRSVSLPCLPPPPPPPPPPAMRRNAFLSTAQPTGQRDNAETIWEGGHEHEPAMRSLPPPPPPRLNAPNKTTAAVSTAETLLLSSHVLPAPPPPPPVSSSSPLSLSFSMHRAAESTNVESTSLPAQTLSSSMLTSPATRSGTQEVRAETTGRTKTPPHWKSMVTETDPERSKTEQVAAAPSLLENADAKETIPPLRRFFWHPLPHASGGVWATSSSCSTSRVSQLGDNVERVVQHLFAVQTAHTVSRRLSNGNTNALNGAADSASLSFSLSHSPSSLLCQQPADPILSRASANASASAARVCRVFGTTRLHNMSITLRHIQLPVRVLVKALVHCDGTVLSSDTRAVLLRALPTTEETAMLIAASKAQANISTGNTSSTNQSDVEGGYCRNNNCFIDSSDTCNNRYARMASNDDYYHDYDNVNVCECEEDSAPNAYTAEDYMRHLVTCVADVRERLQLWCAVDELEETVAQTCECVSAMQRAVCAVCDRHGRWARMLRVVLEFGNALNRATVHGGATGFHLRSLSQLSMLKTNPVTMGSTNSHGSSSNNNNNNNSDRNTTGTISGCNSSKERNTMTTRLSGLEVLVLCLMSSDAGKDVLRLVEDGEVAGRVGPVSQLRGVRLSEVGHQVTQLNCLMQKMRCVVAEFSDEQNWYRRRLPRCVAVGNARRRAAERGDGGDAARDDDVRRKKQDEAGQGMCNDALPVMLSGALTRYLPRLGELALRYQRLREDVRAMLVSYGEEPSTSEETVVWGYVLEFAEEVRMCIARARAGVIQQEMLLPPPGAADLNKTPCNKKDCCCNGNDDDCCCSSCRYSRREDAMCSARKDSSTQENNSVFPDDTDEKENDVATSSLDLSASDKASKAVACRRVAVAANREEEAVRRLCVASSSTLAPQRNNRHIDPEVY